MKKFLLVTTALTIMSTAAHSENRRQCNAECLIRDLDNNAVTRAINEVNNEDQRVVDGTFDATTGTLTLYTQDMKAGNDGNISRRPVVIEGFDALNGADGVDGRDGTDGIDGADGRDGVNGVDGTDGVDGRDGSAGADGVDGTDGADADYEIVSDMINEYHFESLSQRAADRGLASIQTRTAMSGQWTGSIGLSGTEDGADAVNFGMRYGVTDRLDLYAVGSKAFDGDGLAWGAGATFVIGGANADDLSSPRPRVRPEGCLNKLGHITGC